MTTKYATGAFVFTRTRQFTPKRPEEIVPIARKHGFDESIVPPYAGDRAAVGRAIQSTNTRVGSETFLLRPIKRTSTEVCYGIVREEKDLSAERLDHAQDDLVRWTAESGFVQSNHTIDNRVRIRYAELKGKLVTEDWTGTITRELDRFGAVPFREDGRVYWLPPQSLKRVRMLQAFLEEVGFVLAIAEVEAENAGVVTEIVAESMGEQLHKLALEVEDFDGSQKPSTYARRLDIYKTLKQKAGLYRDALGIGAERTEQILTDLENKVSTMLDLRRKTVVHRNGTVEQAQEGRPPLEVPAVLHFAGAEFVQATSPTADIMLFTSGDEHAISSVKALESMGLAAKWQTAGPVQVSIQNSGPKGSETSIKIKCSQESDLQSAKSALAGLGIELAA